MGAVFNVSKVTAGDAVAVFGTGGIGLNACMAAAFAGAMPVIAVDLNPTRRALALRYGATHALDPASGDVVAEIRKLVPGGVDVAVEATGVPSVMANALASTRQQGGRAVVIGNARHGARLDLDPALFNQGKSLLGTWGGDSQPDRDYARFGRLLGAGRFDAAGLLSAPYALADADKALTDLEQGSVGRPLIDMSL
jgi:S-(hydroxymethyl)glutathione dehydrogenase/alcohol dehydrogenase